MEEKMCPILMLSSMRAMPGVDTPESIKSIILCQRNKCEWWQTFYKGQENEYSECAIKSFTSLQDPNGISNRYNTVSRRVRRR